MALLQFIDPIRQRVQFGYAFAACAFGLALLTRFWMGDALPPGFPFLTFFPAVILTAFIGGLGPGIACAVAGGFAAWYWFLPPYSSFGIDQPALLALGFYAFIVTIDIALIHFLVRSMAGLSEERRLTGDLNERLSFMFKELQHRVANNMMLVASLLSLQKRAVAANPELAHAALDEAHSRIMMMSKIHRRLYDPAAQNIPAPVYFQELCSDLLDATGAKNIVCMVDAQEVSFEASKLVTLSLIATELITNSLKHAFEGEQKGTVSVTLKRLDNAEAYSLIIADNGKGLPGGFDPNKSTRLGFKIIQGLAAQLNGRIQYMGSDGAKAELVFPA